MTRPHHISRRLAPVALVGALVAACGSGGEDPTTGSTTTRAATTMTTDEASSPTTGSASSTTAADYPLDDYPAPLAAQKAVRTAVDVGLAACGPDAALTPVNRDGVGPWGPETASALKAYLSAQAPSSTTAPTSTSAPADTKAANTPVEYTQITTRLGLTLQVPTSGCEFTATRPAYASTEDYVTGAGMTADLDTLWEDSTSSPDVKALVNRVNTCLAEKSSSTATDAEDAQVRFDCQTENDFFARVRPLVIQKQNALIAENQTYLTEIVALGSSLTTP